MWGRVAAALLAEQSGSEQVKHRAPPLCDHRRRQWVGVCDLRDNGSAGKIENVQRHDGEDEVMRIDLAEFAAADAFFQQADPALLYRLHELFHEPADVWRAGTAGTHHLALH